MEVLDQDCICGHLPSNPGEAWIKKLKHHRINLVDVGNSSLPIEVLIGGDLDGRFLTGRVQQLENGLTAVETSFGWTIMGRVNAEQSGCRACSLLVTSFVTDMSVPDLWRLETIGIRDPIEMKTAQEKEIAVLEEFKNSVIQSPDGRYEVNLPWRSGKQVIPNNRATAEKRLHGDTQKLKRCGKYEDYDEVFRSWQKENIIEEVEEACEVSRSYYLPHRPVFKEESLTTKIRPVFDASCKTGRAPSLNECLEKGPNLIDLIPDVLHRFRREGIGVISDIRKAFLMISIREEDRDFLRFLWWETSECEKLKIFRHKRVVFGVNSSPFLLGAVIQYHLSKYGDGES